MPRKVVVLNFGLGRVYDFGARWYDAAIGRFTSVDPLASDYSFQSPYVYATNNPVLLRDIMGLGVDTFRVSGSDEFVRHAQQDLEILRNSPDSKDMIKYLDETKEDINITKATSLLGDLKNLFSEGAGNRDIMKATKTTLGRVDVSTGLVPIDVEYSQIYGVPIDDILTISSEVLNHELSHAFDLLTGQFARDSKELGSSAKVRARMEARAMKRTNALRFRKLHLPRKYYMGVRLIDGKGNIVPGTKID